MYPLQFRNITIYYATKINGYGTRAIALTTAYVNVTSSVSPVTIVSMREMNSLAIVKFLAP